jgi:hypothetical protein
VVSFGITSIVYSAFKRSIEAKSCIIFTSTGNVYCYC